MIAYITFLNKKNDKSNFYIKTNCDELRIFLNIFNLNNLELFTLMSKIKYAISLYDNITDYQVFFENNIKKNVENKIIAELSNILYTYFPPIKPVQIFDTPEETSFLFNDLTKFKNIVMQPPPEKSNISYFKYVLDNIPKDYIAKSYDVSTTSKEMFPLCYYVNKACVDNGYFIHVYPKNIDCNKKTLFLIGKAMTYDSGGINLKTSFLEDIKIDMTGSAMILWVLNLLNQTKNDININIHLLMPIVQNSIGNEATLPGSVLTATNGKTIEVINTDAEGRLTIVDAINFINSNLINECNKHNSIILDIATLTGNVSSITGNYAAAIMGNTLGRKYVDELIAIGENIGEYLQYIQIRPEVLSNLRSTVADISNIAPSIPANCLVGGVFINYFCDNKIPWIHIDIGIIAYKNRTQTSYGIYLLFEFIRKLQKNC
jgi:leucyl aminopeptidase